MAVDMQSDPLLGMLRNMETICHATLLGFSYSLSGDEVDVISALKVVIRYFDINLCYEVNRFYSINWFDATSCSPYARIELLRIPIKPLIKLQIPSLNWCSLHLRIKRVGKFIY